MLSLFGSALKKLENQVVGGLRTHQLNIEDHPIDATAKKISQPENVNKRIWYGVIIQRLCDFADLNDNTKKIA